jgi:hypothetical protein
MVATVTLREIAREAYLQRARELAALQEEITTTELECAVGEAVNDAIFNHRVDLAEVAAVTCKTLYKDIDRSETDHGKDVVRKVASGQVPLGTLLDDILVPLGNGIRACFGDMDPDQFQRCDRVRYDDVRRVNQAYSEWREVYDYIMGVITPANMTFREAVTQGLLPMNKCFGT